MDQFEYVVVLTSLILGLGIAQILTGIADVLSNYKNSSLYLPHSLFVIQIFLLHIQEWWINYEYASIIDNWTLKIVLSILAYPILLYLMARMIFPTGIRGSETDFKAYYEDQWRFIFVIGLIAVILSIIQNAMISNIPVTDQWPQIGYLVVYAGFVLSNTKNNLAHILFQTVTVLILIGYVITDMTQLEAY